MSTSILDAPTIAPPNAEDEICHLVCDCDENTARCGMDVTDHPWTPLDVNDCVVCDDLPPCEVCGC